jgi:hypothetical protein
MIAFVLALALAAPNPASIDAPRHAFQACLKSFESNQLRAKIAADASFRRGEGSCPDGSAGAVRRFGEVRHGDGTAGFGSSPTPRATSTTIG